MLEWNFKRDFIGYAYLYQQNQNTKEVQRFKIKLYQDGRAVIGCHHWKDENVKKFYNVSFFWCNKEHLQNCLKDNVIYNEDWQHVDFVFYNDYWYVMDYVKLFVKYGVKVTILKRPARKSNKGGKDNA